MSEIVYKEESYNIIGVCLRVYNELGPGFLEAVYSKALEREFNVSGIPFKRQAKLDIYYKDEPLGKYYVADFLVYDRIVVELKTVSFVLPQHLRQVHNYLKATGMRLGLIVNFGNRSFESKRILNKNATT